jgi:twitching motility protein PilT
MPHIDRFIEAMLSKPGSFLHFRAGSEPLLIRSGRGTPLMSRQASAGQVRHLVAEVMGAAHRALVEKEDVVEFQYQMHNTAPVVLNVTAWSGNTECTVRRSADGEAQQDPTAKLDGLAPDRPSIRSGPTGAQTGALGGAVAGMSGGERSGAAGPMVPAAPPVPNIQSAPGARGWPGASTLQAAEAPPTPEAGAGPTKETAARTGRNAPIEIVGEPSSGVAPIHRLFHALVQMGGSDLHLTSKETPIIRKDGDMLRLTGEVPLGSDELDELLAPITPPRNRQEFLEGGDTDFAYEIPGLARFRANLFRDRSGVGAVFRTIPSKVLTADQLGLPQAVRDLGLLNKGLVVVTGPTGSGKSTTLAALVDYVNATRSGHIITIEDPIEFVHENKRCLVNQREVAVHTSSFKRALRAALREDPDIVLVGEMRDLETIAIAIETAETGHLVFGTLHTTTAYSTIDRIIDQFPTDRQEQIRVMLSESLKGVVAQTLCKKIGGGRAAALEILIVTKAVTNLIREGKTFQIPSIMQTSRNLGMRTLNESLLELVKSGTVEPAEAYLKSVDKQGFLSACEQAGFRVTPG